MLTANDYRLRKGESTDVSFIYHSWLKCYLIESPITKYLKPKTFFKGHHKVLERIFERPQLTITVACPNDEQDPIYGYIVYEPNLIHFIYVKDAFRKMGIGKRLLESIGDVSTCEASHITYTLMDLWTEKKITCEYNQYWEDR